MKREAARRLGNMRPWLEKSGCEVKFMVSVVGVTGISRRFLRDETIVQMGVSRRSCKASEGRVARRT